MIPRIVLMCTLLLASCAARPAATPPSVPFAGDAYYLSDCAACAGMLGAKGDTLDRVIGGRDYRFCSEACVAEFEKNPAAGARRVDARMAADQRPHYPLKTSIVSGLPLPARPVEVVLGNRLFLVANKSETTTLVADPGAYLQRLNRAVIEAQSPTYGMKEKCPVQGDILASDTPIDIVIANRMIRVCCIRCVRVVRARPSQYLAMVDYSNRESKAHPEH